MPGIFIRPMSCIASLLVIRFAFGIRLADFRHPYTPSLKDVSIANMRRSHTYLRKESTIPVVDSGRGV